MAFVRTSGKHGAELLESSPAPNTAPAPHTHTEINGNHALTIANSVRSLPILQFYEQLDQRVLLNDGHLSHLLIDDKTLV